MYKYYSAINKKVRKIRLIETVMSFIDRTSISTLVYVPPITSLLLLGGFLFIAGKVFKENIPEEYLGIAGAVFAIIAGFSGLAQIIKREAPFFFGFTVRGVWPILTGLLWILFCWYGAILLIYYAFH